MRDRMLQCSTWASPREDPGKYKVLMTGSEFQDWQNGSQAEVLFSLAPTAESTFILGTPH